MEFCVYSLIDVIWKEKHDLLYIEFWYELVVLLSISCEFLIQGAKRSISIETMYNEMVLWR